MLLPSFLRKLLRVSTRRRSEAGTTLIELIVYIAILTIMTVIILRAVLQLTGVFAKSRIERRVSLAAETALERIVRELRLAQSITCLAPDYNFVCGISGSGGAIKTLTSKSHTDNTDVTKSFYLSNASPSQIIYDPDVSVANNEQPLTPDTVTIDSLTFKQLYTVAPPGKILQAAGVRIELQISGGSGSTKVTHTYYASAVLRGDY